MTNPIHVPSLWSVSKEFPHIFLVYLRVLIGALLFGSLTLFLVAGLQSGMVWSSPTPLVLPIAAILVLLLSPYFTGQNELQLSRLVTSDNRYGVRQIILKGLSTAFNNFGITMLTLLLFPFLYSIPLQAAINGFDGFSGTFVAIAGVIGTIIVLLYSLSMISIQRAAETFTPFITKLYRDDQRASLGFIFLVVICIVSFLLSIKNLFLGFSYEQLFPVLILNLAITFDSTRQHYRRMSRLMETSGAIELLLREILKGINASPRDEVTLRGIGELSELALKSISREEVNTAAEVIDAIYTVAEAYVDRRKQNIKVFPSPEFPFVMINNAYPVMNGINETLMRISHRAVKNDLEAVSIRAVEVLGKIGEKLVASGHDFEIIAYEPIGYITMSSTRAEDNNLYDVALRSSKAFLKFGQFIGKQSEDLNTYFTLLREYRKLIQYTLLRRNGLVANSILKDEFALIGFIFRDNPAVSNLVWRQALDDAYSLVPLLIQNEIDLSIPFAPYAMTNVWSVGYLIKMLGAFVNDNADGRYTYAEFVKINDALASHFRSIASNRQLKNLATSGLIWNISETIAHVLDICMPLLGPKTSDQPKWAEELTNTLRFYISFYWAAFDSSETVNTTYAWQASQKLSYIGLSYYENGYENVTESVINSIRSIADSAWEKGTRRKDYVPAEILIFISHIRWLAIARKDESMLQMIELELSESRYLNSDRSLEIRRHLDRQEHELKRNLVSVNYFRMPNDPTSYLSNLLGNKYPQVLDQILTELYPRRHDGNT